MRYLVPLALFASPLAAGEADVIAATATFQSGQMWTVEATVQHADTGWKHFANAFEVLGPDGAVLATRQLAHPHVHEQPFARSVTATIPEGVTEITVRAVDLVHGHGGAETTVMLER